MKELLIEKSNTLHQYRTYSVISEKGELSDLINVYPIVENNTDLNPTYAVKVDYSLEAHKMRGIALFEGSSIHSANWCKGDIYWDSNVSPKQRYITLVGLMEADNLESFLQFFVKTMCMEMGAIQLKPTIENRTFTTKEFTEIRELGQFGG